MRSDNFSCHALHCTSLPPEPYTIHAIRIRLNLHAITYSLARIHNLEFFPVIMHFLCLEEHMTPEENQTFLNASSYHECDVYLSYHVAISCRTGRKSCPRCRHVICTCKGPDRHALPEHSPLASLASYQAYVGSRKSCPVCRHVACTCSKAAARLRASPQLQQSGSSSAISSPSNAPNGSAQVCF
jgi:hypothetical protein